MNYDISEKTNLKTLEDWEEMFVDVLEDAGVFSLALNETVSYGTYENVFTCVNEERVDGDEGVRELTREVTAQFYEVEDTVTLIVKTYVGSDGDLCDLEAYWFDTFGNDTPHQHPNWRSMVENMDIFLDDEDDDLDYDDD